MIFRGLSAALQASDLTTSCSLCSIDPTSTSSPPSSPFTDWLTTSQERYLFHFLWLPPCSQIPPSLSLLFMSKCNFPPIIYFFISLSLFSQFCRRGWCGSSMVTLRIDSGTSAEYARARAKSCYSKGGRKKKNAACNITTTTQEILPNQLFAVFINFLWTWGVSAPSS